MEIIGLLIAGIIIGLLGKFIAPGDRDNIPIWLTILCGIAGVLLGFYVVGSLFGDDATTTDGIDWVRWIVSIVIAAILVMIASAVTGRSSTGRTRV